MKKRLSSKSAPYILSFAVGGVIYGLIEILWRGRTHWTMLVTGGVCSSFLYKIKDTKLPPSLLSLVAGGVITVIEFISGCLVNLLFHLKVWDYSRCRCNLFGQICLPYSILWCALSLPAMTLLRILDKKIFKK